MSTTHCLTLACLAAALSCLTGADAASWRNTLRPEGERAPALTLAADGSTDYVIVVPAAATTQDKKAAEDLAQWLGQITDATFVIVPDSDAARDCEISIGNTSRLAGACLRDLATNLGNEGYAIAQQGERLFLVGGKKRGPINAVYALLEEDLGCRWYSRTATKLPHRRTLRVQVVPRSFAPKFMLRDPFYHDAFDGTWSLRNRTNAPSASVPEEYGGNIDYDGLFVHTYNALVPPDKYFAEHPEYYMESGGKRTPRQLCQTNPDVVRIATEYILAALKASPNTEIVEVSPNDGGGHCTCPSCKALDDANGSPSGPLITFVNQIAEGVEKVHPEVWISTLAYLDTVDAPSKVKPRRNVAVRLCNDLHSWRYPLTCFWQDTQPESIRYTQAIEKWAAIGANLTIWDYFVNFSHYLAPMPNMDVLQPTIDFYLEHNVVGVMMQAAYQGFGGEFAPMRSWVMAKVMWDPSLSVDALMQDFFTGFYGGAADEIMEYNNLLYKAKRDHMDTAAKPEGGIRYDMNSPFLSHEFLQQATAIFARAEKLCPTDEMLYRVQLAKLPVLYTKLMQGPDKWADEYAAVLAEFETIARRENVVYLYEGGASLDQLLNSWRDSVRVKQNLSSIRPGDVTIVPLPNVWRFATDPKDVGAGEKWFAEGFDDSKWATVRSDKGNGWESQGFEDYTGVGWYRQQVPAPADLGPGHVYLYFGAVDEDATIYVNGKQAFEHTCASTGLAPDQIWVKPFVFDARPFVRAGQKNTLAVRVYNRLGMGGVWKPVQVVASAKDLDAALIEAVMGRG